MVAAVTGNATIPIAEDETRILAERSNRPSAPLVEGDRYQVGEAIGRGGMGEIVAAHDVHIGRDVAIKRLYVDDPPSSSKLQNFLREARIQGRLEHPAIPPVYELAVDAEGRPYFAMRKLEGITLAQTLQDPVSAYARGRLLRAFVDVCNAIDLAHSNRIIHLDIKPGNILLGPHGETYVLDWGIAREIDRLQPPITVGTPGYMAPEQVRADTDLDARVDVYALGCVLFELLTGRPLHPRGHEGMNSAVRGVQIPHGELPPELAWICRRATAGNREERLGSARELGDAVQRYLDGDRDLERRRELAREHLEAAHEVLNAPGDEEIRRSTAMREAGRALALDPTFPGAAELLGRIMLEPPKQMPAELKREQQAREYAEGRLMARLSFITTGFHFAFVPVLYALGIHDLPYIGAFTGLCLIMMATSAVGMRASQKLPIANGLFAISYIAMIALTARMFTPFLVAPGAGAVAVSSFMLNPISRSRIASAIVTIGVLGAVLGVLAAESIGWLSPSTRVVGNVMTLRSPLEGVEDFPVMGGMCFFIVTCMLTSSVCSHVLMHRVRQSRDQLDMHAWHLRQLLSTSR